MAKGATPGIIVGIIFVLVIMFVLYMIFQKGPEMLKKQPLFEFACENTGLKAVEYEEMISDALYNENWEEVIGLYGEYDSCFPSRPISAGMRGRILANVGKCALESCRDLREELV